MKVRKKVWTTAMTATMAGAILAAGGSRAEETETTKMSDVLVTATRTPVDPATVGSSVSVVTSEEITARSLTTVTEALRTVPGVTVVSQSGGGSIASVFIRGHNSNQTKVMLNGVKLNSNAGGGYDFSNLVVDDIDRIEVVRGPQSALYGSDSVGGVINIITKTPEHGVHGSAEVAMGVEGYRRSALEVSAANDIGYVRAGYSYTTLDANSVALEENGNPEEDGWESHDFSFGAGATFLEDGKVDFSLNYLEDWSELDGFDFVTFLPADDDNYEQDRQTLVLGLNISKPITDVYTQSFSFGYTRDEVVGTDEDNAANDYDIESKNFQFGAQADFFVGDSDTLTVGYDYERQSAESVGSYDENLDINSVYVQNHWIINEIFSLTAGVRYDDHETFGDETTFRLAGTAVIPETETKFHASYGTGFKAPTLNDLYWPVSAFTAGNPDLEAETSKSVDIGVTQPFMDGRFEVDVTYFHSSVDDLIQWAADPVTFVFTPDNVSKADIDGIEVSARLQVTEDLDVSAQYTYTDAEDDATGDQLARRGRHNASGTISYDFLDDRANASVTVMHVGTRYDDAANTTELDPYTRVDFAARYDVTENLRVFLRVENLFDEDYVETDGYDINGCYWYAGLRCSF
jgi:vitamin B12 transporter